MRHKDSVIIGNLGNSKHRKLPLLCNLNSLVCDYYECVSHYWKKENIYSYDNYCQLIIDEHFQPHHLRFSYADQDEINKISEV